MKKGKSCKIDERKIYRNPIKGNNSNKIINGIIKIIDETNKIKRYL